MSHRPASEVGRHRALPAILLVALLPLSTATIRAEPSPAPLAIPLQNRFPAHEPAGADPAAAAAWQAALSAEQANEPPQTIMLKLTAIWARWPDSVQAYQAHLFALEDLESEFLSPPYQTTSADFVANAKRLPAIYFSESRHAATLSVADRAVRLAEARNLTAEAWNLCLELRWLAPRLGPLAATCDKVAKRNPTQVGSAERTLAQLPPGIRRGDLNEAASAELAKAVGHYLRQPYDSAALEALIELLDQAGRRDLTAPLIEELLQFDPTITWDHKSGRLKPYAR